jgi:hypothetical protein
VLVLALPVFGILILIWTVSAGVMALAYRPQVG